MDVFQPQPRRKSRARERYEARRKQIETTEALHMHEAASFEDPAFPSEPRLLGSARERAARKQRRAIDLAFSGGAWRDKLRVLAQDAWWYTLHRPYVLQAVIILVVVLFAMFVGSHLLTGRMFPNVWALGISLGDLDADEAQAALQQAWNTSIEIALVDGSRSWTARPAELGMMLDTAATVEAARKVGMAGIPLGYHVTPVVNLDLFVAQDYLLRMSDTASYPPVNATYTWSGNALVGVPGSDGRALDVGMTMEYLRANPAVVAENRRLPLVMTPLQPETADPTPYLDAARAIASQPFSLLGYDPFLDQQILWQTDRATFTSWLEASADGLTLRASTFAQFLTAQNHSLNDGSVAQGRFLEPTETMEKVREAIRAGKNDVTLRIRYRESLYTIQPGDTGFKIARKTGIPFALIENANPGVDWDRLTLGSDIRIPSRDVTLPIDPQPGKRIIVNLDTQSLVAYENGQMVFNWLISSGMGQAPTYPGIFQVLSHDDVAAGSSYDLCSTTGCAQWKMYWFMGIYEVVPGLMNGFHGAVLLPNGAYLGGGNVGRPYTYGCIMSENSNAEKLYHWADEGTVVEIISSEHPPISDLGLAALGMTVR